MYKRYYDGYTRSNVQTDCGEIIVPENLSGAKEEINLSANSAALPRGEIEVTSCNEKRTFLNLPCELDDIIIIGILLFVLLDRNNDNDGNNDIFTLIILGVILFSDIF